MSDQAVVDNPTPAIAEIPPIPLIESSRITPLMIDEYALWFVNSPNFYIQNSYLLPADFDKGMAWARVKAPISALHIQRHLEGHHTIGCYTVNPENQCVKWFGVDGDYPGSEIHLQMIAEAMKADGLSPALEESRRGGHLWVLSSEPIPAKTARIYLYQTLDLLGLAIKGVRGIKDGLEIFPKQETLEPGQVGNGLRGPFGIHRKVMRRCWFLDADPNLEAQFHYIRHLPRCSWDQIEELTLGMAMPEDLIEEEREPGTYQNSGEGFDITPFIDMKVFARGRRSAHFACPSCRAAGRDNGKDNLHVTMEPGPRYVFWCFAGCSFKEIITACGWSPSSKRQREGNGHGF